MDFPSKFHDPFEPSLSELFLVVEQFQQRPFNDIDLRGLEPVGRLPSKFTDPFVLDVERHERILHPHIGTVTPDGFT